MPVCKGYILKDVYTKECLGSMCNDVTCIILGEFQNKLKVKGYFNNKFEQIKLIDKDKMKYFYKKS